MKTAASACILLALFGLALPGCGGGKAPASNPEVAPPQINLQPQAFAAFAPAPDLQASALPPPLDAMGAAAMPGEMAVQGFASPTPTEPVALPAPPPAGPAGAAASGAYCTASGGRSVPAGDKVLCALPGGVFIEQEEFFRSGNPG